MHRPRTWYSWVKDLFTINPKKVSAIEGRLKEGRNHTSSQTRITDTQSFFFQIFLPIWLIDQISCEEFRVFWVVCTICLNCVTVYFNTFYRIFYLGLGYGFALWVSRVLKYPKKYLEDLTTFSYVYLMRGFQKYERKWIITMAFWATCQIAQPIQPIWQHIFALP